MSDFKDVIFAAAKAANDTARSSYDLGYEAGYRKGFQEGSNWAMDKALEVIKPKEQTT